MSKKLKNRKGLPMEHIKALKELTEMDEVKAENEHLKAQLAVARAERDGYAQNAAFYRCCAMSGEVPTDGAEPYKPAGQGGEG